jgi:tripartite ATP-independent transporter DctP family solute receptor
MPGPVASRPSPRSTASSARRLPICFGPKGIEVLAWWENGFRNITNNKHPIVKPADLAGIKIRVTPDKVRLATFERLGAQPAPLAFGELYSALQQGVFDAQENPLSIIDASSFYEVQKYVSMTGHIWGAACLTVSSMTWAQVSPEDQAIVKEAAVKWGNAQRQMVADNEGRADREAEIERACSSTRWTRLLSSTP